MKYLFSAKCFIALKFITKDEEEEEEEGSVLETTVN